jgi:alpha-glucosidase
MLVGEIGDDYQNLRMAEYTYGNARLHTAYAFSLLSGTAVALTPMYIRRAIEEELGAAGADSWPTWAFSNHDVPRSASRLGPRNISNPDWPKMLFTLLMCLRGSICVYQGEELGLPEASVPRDRLQDPWGQRVSDVWQGRDGCRTPMPWNDALPNYGFSAAANTWLPVAPEHQGHSVTMQDNDPNSILSAARAAVRFRKSHPALTLGDIEFIDCDDPDVLAFTRSHAGQTMLCVFNLGDDAAKYGTKFEGGLLNQAGSDGSLGAFGFAVVPVDGSRPSRSRAKPYSFWTRALSALGSFKGSVVRHIKKA